MKRECIYTLPEGVNVWQANKKRAIDVENSNTNLRSVVELLRHSSEGDSALALKRIREAENVDDAIDTLTAANVLLAASPKAISKPRAVIQSDQNERPFPQATKRRITSPSGCPCPPADHG